MKNREIRCPKFCAVIFLIEGLISLPRILLHVFPNEIFTNRFPFTTETLIYAIIGSISAIFISVILFMKRYDKLLVGAIGTMVVSEIVNTVINSPNISNILSLLVDVLLLVLTIVMVLGSDSLKKIAIKYQYIVPIMLIVSLVVGIVYASKDVFDKAHLDTSSIVGITAIMSILVIIPSGIISVVKYLKLTNWLADPYEKN